MKVPQDTDSTARQRWSSEDHVMVEPTLLLISRDKALIEAVDYLARDVGGLGLSVVTGLDEAYTFEGWPRAALLMIHHEARGSINGVSRLLRMIAAAKRQVATIILADVWDETETADLLRQGAADVLPRPFDLERMVYLTEALTLRRRQPLVTPPSTAYPEPPVTWDDSDPLVAQARRVAPQDAPILIHGEVGTGKSCLARMIHELSSRRTGPFVTVRCGALHEERFEQELFGWSFDGATTLPIAGKLGQAREGTLLLDDVDQLSRLAQAAILRWIEDEARAAAGQASPQSGRPRIIATVRGSLSEAVAQGRFRSDLYYRLNVIGINLAPLRERRDEIKKLAVNILSSLAGRSVSLTEEALAAIAIHSWPGNIGELREALEIGASRSHDYWIGLESLPEAVRMAPLRAATVEGTSSGRSKTRGSGPVTLAETKRDAEYLRITQALEKHGQNRLRTACELGISRMTLYKKLYKYGIIEQQSPGANRSGSRSKHHRTPPDPGHSDSGSDSSPPGLQSAANPAELRHPLSRLFKDALSALQ
jgi:two-component system response regulator AtoC